MNTPDWQTKLQQGIRAVQEQRGTDALRLLESANRSQPGLREPIYWLGNAQRLCGQVAQAEKSFRHLLQSNPMDLEAGLALAFLLRENSRSSELDSLLIPLAKAIPDNSNGQLQIAGFLRDSNRFKASIDVMRAVLTGQPGEASNHFRLARLLQGTGQHQDALQSYRDALQINPDLGGAWLGLAQLQRFSDPGQADWVRILDAPVDKLSTEAAMCLAFARGKGYDDLGEPGAAWQQFVAGNRLRTATQAWDRTKWQQFVADVQAQPLIHGQPSPGTRHPVYIVGMLRSGTTLLEQLLDQHSNVTARGELNFLAHAWKQRQEPGNGGMNDAELGSMLWSHLQLDGPANGSYIDKNPLNFRFISLLAQVLPEARIIHLVRDGRDSCLSCFSQLFQHPDAAFSNQLDDLVDYYAGYSRLMQYFKATFPGMILDVEYRQLVTHTGATMDRVMDFLGLPQLPSNAGEQAVSKPGDNLDEQRPIRTASAWQARQQIHQKSLGRWQAYYDSAPDFFDQIARLDEQYR